MEDQLIFQDNMAHVGNLIMRERAQELLDAAQDRLPRRPQFRDPKFKENANENFDIATFFKDHLTCSICNQILFHPVTLTCQHSYCYCCLSELQKSQNENGMMNGGMRMMPMQLRRPGDPPINENTLQHKCPTCNTRFFLPPHKMQNYVLRNIIESFIDDPEYFEEREKEVQMRDPNLKNELREELKRELLPDIMDNLQLYDRNDRDICMGGPMQYMGGMGGRYQLAGNDELPTIAPTQSVDEEEDEKEPGYLSQFWTYMTADTQSILRYSALAMGGLTTAMLINNHQTFVDAVKNIYQRPGILTGLGVFFFMDYITYQKNNKYQIQRPCY